MDSHVVITEEPHVADDEPNQTAGIRKVAEAGDAHLHSLKG